MESIRTKNKKLQFPKRIYKKCSFGITISNCIVLNIKCTDMLMYKY